MYLRKGSKLAMAILTDERNKGTCIFILIGVIWIFHEFFHTVNIDFKLKKVLLPPPGIFADISYLEENFKLHLLRDVCTLCSGALVSDSLLHMLL